MKPRYRLSIPNFICVYSPSKKFVFIGFWRILWCFMVLFIYSIIGLTPFYAIFALIYMRFYLITPLSWNCLTAWFIESVVTWTYRSKTQTILQLSGNTFRAGYQPGLQSERCIDRSFFGRYPYHIPCLEFSSHVCVPFHLKEKSIPAHSNNSTMCLFSQG